MSSSALFATDAARGWRPWGVLVPILGLVLIIVPTAGMSLLVKLTPGGPAYLTGGAEGPEGSLFCSLILTGGIIAVLARRARRRLRAGLPCLHSSNCDRGSAETIHHPPRRS